MSFWKPHLKSTKNMTDSVAYVSRNRNWPPFFFGRCSRDTTLEGSVISRNIIFGFVFFTVAGQEGLSTGYDSQV